MDLNQHLEVYSQLFDYVQYVNIRDTMLNAEGTPKAEIFLEDKLHMNTAGYDLWAEVIKKYIN